MAEELLVVLSRRDPSCGLGFSLLGTPGLPPIIYDIVENSPAAESGKITKLEENDPEQFVLGAMNAVMALVLPSTL